MQPVRIAVEIAILDPQDFAWRLGAGGECVGGGPRALGNEAGVIAEDEHGDDPRLHRFHETGSLRGLHGDHGTSGQNVWRDGGHVYFERPMEIEEIGTHPARDLLGYSMHNAFRETRALPMRICHLQESHPRQENGHVARGCYNSAVNRVDARAMLKKRCRALSFLTNAWLKSERY